jgi:hypothetical protein
MIAPLIESSPPTMTAGMARRAKSAVPAVRFPEPTGTMAAKVPATAARTAAMAHAMAKTRPTGMPWAMAASWSKAVARMAMPMRVRKKRFTPAKAARAHNEETICVWGIRMSPSLQTSRPHGFPMFLSVVPRKSLSTLRRAMSRPRVMMTIEKSGSPTIGRIATRSRINPMTAAQSRERSTASPHWNQRGPPVHRPGMSFSTAKVATKNAPTEAMAPWAKFTTWVALKMSTNPRARRAYSEPRA